KQEPYEHLVIDIEEDHQGPIMEQLGLRRGGIQDMQPDGKGRIRVEYIAPARGLVGFGSLFMTLTSRTGILNSVFSHYGDFRNEKFADRNNGVLITNTNGKVLAFALFNLQERGRLFLPPTVDVYEGQIVGIHARDNDLVVNPT